MHDVKLLSIFRLLILVGNLDIAAYVRIRRREEQEGVDQEEVGQEEVDQEWEGSVGGGSDQGG